MRSSVFRFRGRPGHHIFADSHRFLDSQRAGGGAMVDIAVYQIDLVLWMPDAPRVKSVLASEERLSFNPLTLTTGAGGRRSRRETLLDGRDEDTAGFGNITQQFVDAIGAGRQPYTSGREALEVTRVIHAAYESASIGRTVALV